MINSDQNDNSYFNDNKSEPQIKENKYYSILPDLATGWRPKNAKIAAPIFVTYEDTLTQIAFQSALATLNKLIYVGPRHDNSYKFHSLTQHNYNVKYGIKSQQVPSKLKKELQQFTIKSNSRKGLFVGMNPNTQKQLKFESNFESGNLDLVIKISPSQYNLFLRPDTNTKGHMQWFYFKINNQFYPHQKVRLNICNNKKFGVLFSRGMKPFVYSKYVQSNKGIKWQQCGQNVQYKRLSQKQDNITNFLKLQNQSPQLLNKYFCLSFDYTFQSSNDQVYFAYCPPFTYSQMKSHIQILKKKSNPSEGLSVTEQNLCTSLSGLQIPIVTITDQSIQQSDKKCVFVTGRFHPGESNGSHVLKGFLDFLVTPEAQYLRKKIIFKIVPMVNPDGVVFGNFRTSLSGKDLNRKFKAKNDELFPEVVNLKSFVIKLKRQIKIKMLYFLDFHGHSMKKNVFLYGPQYDIWSTKYQRSKILPKIISYKTNMFRYQSCLFRVAATKKTTARAFMLGFIPYCYTIQSSVGLFKLLSLKQNFAFDQSKWEQMGRIIAQSLKQSIMKIDKERQILLPKKKKKTIISNQFEINKQNLNNLNKQVDQSQQEQLEADKTQQQKSILKPQSGQGLRQKIKFRQKQAQLNKTKFYEKQSPKQKQDIHQLKKSSSSIKSIGQKQKQISQVASQTIKSVKNPFIELGCPQINEVDNESDGYSQGKSDCQSDDNDFDKQQYKKLSGKIMKFIENFNLSIVGERRKKIKIRNRKKIISSNNNSSIEKQKFVIGLRKNSTSNNSNLNQDIMKMVPSLKHKMLKREKELSEKRIIGGQDRQQPPFKNKKTSIYRFDQQRER